MKRTWNKVVALSVALMGILYAFSYMDRPSMKAAGSYASGDKVYIGNDAYIVIDPNSMTLLKEDATADGEMTWDAAQASLTSLSSNYGELGSKLVNNHFALPSTTDLALITNADQTALTTIAPIASDWWLGDASVDNRSKFVGANTNSLITDVSIVKNVIDTTNIVCSMDQTVTEQGIKPTKTEPDQTTTGTYQLPNPKIMITAGTDMAIWIYSDAQCTNFVTGMAFNRTEANVDINALQNDSALLPSDALTFDTPWLSEQKGASSPNFVWWADIVLEHLMAASGMNDYIRQYVSNPVGTPSFSATYTNLFDKNTCYAVPSIFEKGKNDNEPITYGYNYYKLYDLDSGAKQISIDRIIDSKTVTCGGHAQTAGESAVRPLLTIDKSKIAYSNAAKPSFQVSTTLNETVPEVNGGLAYLAIQDSDLGIALDTSHPDVDGNTLKIDRSAIGSIVSIPVTLSGTTSGNRYVSAVAMTNAGNRYAILDVINGTSGIVQLDISNFLNWQTAGKISVTLYQEVDEGTNTTYRGDGTMITLDIATPITAITFQPNYPNGKASWNEGDSGIGGAGEKTGTFGFSGGTSGVMDPTTNTDYKSYEIVDAFGNAITDANFRINGNELIAKKKITAGIYTLNIKVIDHNDETFVDTITIDVGKASNPFTWNAIVKNKSSLYYGDTLTLGVIGVMENATVTYLPTTHINGNVFTATKPDSAFTISATSSETASYGITTIQHTLVIEKRPLSLQVQLKDGTGQWQNSVTIQQGQALPDHQIIIDNSDPDNKGLVNGDSLTDTKLGSVHYEYRQGTNVITNPSAQSGTYEVYAVYGNSDYYDIKVKAATLIVSNPITINNANKGQFYEFRLSDGSIADITKWQKEDIIIHPKHSDYSLMKVDNGSYQSGDYTYAKEGNNTVALSFQNNGGASTGVINEVLKIDKTDPVISQVEFMENGNVKSESSGVFQYLFKNSADITISADDHESGIARYLLTLTPLKEDGSVDPSKQVIQHNTPSHNSSFTYTIGNQGCYLVEIAVEDEAGRTKSYAPKKIRIHSQQITLALKGYINGDYSKPYDETKWTNQAVLLEVKASDGTALTNQQISFDNSTWQPMPNGTYMVSNQSSINDQTYYMKATNIEGDEISAGIQIKIDVDAPISLRINYTDIKQNAYRSFLRAITFQQLFKEEQLASFSASDALSGMDHYEYTIQEKDNNGQNIGNAISGSGSSYRFTKDKNYEITVIAYDKAGNASQPLQDTLQIDTKPPVITGVKDQSVYKQYYIPRFVMVKEEGSGLAQAYYKKDGAMVQTLMDSVEEKIKGEGSYEIYAIDNAGNDSTITFKIVALPDIDTEIDGSDESKDIIDQIKQEYEEVKDRLDEEERSDYEQWIEDATKKWEDSRKTVLETEDKTAKVEGQGDVSFDPSIELIVDPIESSQLPQLPRKAIHAYDVYLLKDNVVVQPNGSIKVYLPYKESEEPIVYQIEENGNVREIPAVKEGNYVTFITDQLEKYAISNTAQPDQTCKLEGTEINIDTDGDGLPDVNVDLDGNCKADINIDVDGDQIPDIDIDTDGDGKADINIDNNKDGKADVNIVVKLTWKPNVTFTVDDFSYNSMKDLIPDLNIDDDGDGKPDRNIDSDGDGLPDVNVDDDWWEKHGYDKNPLSNSQNNGTGVNTGDTHKWQWWLLILAITTITMIYTLIKNKKQTYIE